MQSTRVLNLTTFTMELSGFRKKRAQVFSGEFLLAYFVFSLALITSIYLWNSINSDIVESEQLYDMEEIAVNSAEKLVNTRGLPDNWSSGEAILSIGLVNESRFLDQGKILKFVEIMNDSNYEDNKYLIGAGKYDFYFAITDTNGSIIRIGDQNISTGRFPVNWTGLTPVRNAIFNNTIVQVRLIVWKPV